MRDLMQTTAKVRGGHRGDRRLEIVGDPIGPVLAFTSDTIDLYAVADVMDDRGWNLNRNTDPHGLAPHALACPRRGRRRAGRRPARAVRHHGESRGVEARYS